MAMKRLKVLQTMKLSEAWAAVIVTDQRRSLLWSRKESKGKTQKCLSKRLEYADYVGEIIARLQGVNEIPLIVFVTLLGYRRVERPRT